ncbi:hypothetical protein [Oerskovia enterophila]|uniref:Lipoprotein n=1 Tax=Oerskovia enterophila TaxID=43678 RepID=A0ABX2Y0L3_9CELL|nr:hypothetical protein [Oerskovia enterophila]OCI30035.1 hypothetical protein OERS_32450 [Oerskovia enterophila]
MRTRTAAIAAVLGVALLVAGCSGGGESEEVASPLEDEKVVPSPSEDAKDACGVVFNGGDGSLAFRIPEALIDVQANLQGERLQTMLDINSQLTQAISQATPEVAAPLRSIQVPFQQVQDVVDAGGGDLTMDTSRVAEDVTDLMAACVDAGFTVSD